MFLLENILKLNCLGDISKVTLPNNPPFLHHYYLIDYLSELYRVGWHYDSLASQIPAESFPHQELTHVDVDSTQHIVQQINISV